MKLNKHGWGLSQMLVMIAILFALLMIAAYFIYAFYDNFNTSTATVYVELENDIAYAARDYIKDGHEKKRIITLKELKKYEYIYSFSDYQDNPCDGYVIYEDGVYYPYIKCDNYSTKNYDKNIK